MPVIKIIEVIGTSKKSFDEAVEKAIERTSKTIQNVTGVDITGHKLVIEKGKIVEYRVNLKIAFVVVGHV